MASPAFEGFIGRAWLRRGWLAWLLWPLSVLYGVLSALRRYAYARGWVRSTRLPLPVVVVGNIFVGGTGKTPLTIWLVQALQAAGWRPGVVSRGHGARVSAPAAPDALGAYRGRLDDTIEVLADADPARVGDEPLLIAQRCQCPVVVGRQRVTAAQALLAAHPEVNILVSDDGLQHYALQRDVEIMLFDQRGSGNGWLLPAGPLRESVRRRADFVVFNGNNAPPADSSMWLQAPQLFQMQLDGSVAENLAAPQRRQTLAAFTGQGAAAAGIGNPERFFSMLRAANLQFEALPLPDHYAFQENPFADLTANWILITEKDAVKCRQHPELKHDRRLWVVPVSARIDGALAQQIVEKCGGFPTT